MSLNPELAIKYVSPSACLRVCTVLLWCIIILSGPCMLVCVITYSQEAVQGSILHILCHNHDRFTCGREETSNLSSHHHLHHHQLYSMTRKMSATSLVCCTTELQTKQNAVMLLFHVDFWIILWSCSSHRESTGRAVTWLKADIDIALIGTRLNLFFFFYLSVCLSRSLFNTHIDTHTHTESYDPSHSF